MRVCVLAYSFYEVDTRILQYTKSLLERGDQVDVIALRRPEQSPFEVVAGARVYRIQERTVNERGPLSYLWRTLRFFVHSFLVITKLHWQKRYDIAHVHSVPDFLVFSAASLRLTGVPVILDIHDILPEFYASKFKVSKQSLMFRALVFVEQVSAKFASHVIIANDLWKERLLKRSVTPEKCSAFCNYPDADRFYPRARTRNDGKFQILYPGSLNWHQGLDVAIRAFARIKDQIPNAEFHIYGEGAAKPDLITLAGSLHLEDRVIFHEWTPLDEVVQVMCNADLAVVPKRASSAFGTEAASTKIMEFMSVGVPVIVSRTKIDEFYHNDSRVEFFASEDEPALASAMLRLSADSNRRQELVRNAAQHAKQSSWAAKKVEYLALVDRLAGREAAAVTPPQSFPPVVENSAAESDSPVHS